MFGLGPALVAAILSVIAVHTDRGVTGGCGCRGNGTWGDYNRRGNGGCGCSGANGTNDRGCGCGRG